MNTSDRSQDRDQATAGSDDFPRLDKLVFDAARYRRVQHGILEHGFELRDLGFGRGFRRIGLGKRSASALDQCRGDEVLRLSSFELGPRPGGPLFQVDRALHFEFRQVVLGLPDCDVGFGAGNTGNRALSSGLRSGELARSSAVSSLAISAPRWTQSPSLTRTSATRPASLAAISTRVTSMRPLAAANPVGACVAARWFQYRYPPALSISAAMQSIQSVHASRYRHPSIVVGTVDSAERADDA